MRSRALLLSLPLLLGTAISGCAAIALDPSDAYAHYNLGSLYKELKRYDEAIGHLKDLKWVL